MCSNNFSDEVFITGDNVLELMFAAKKYLLEGLTTKCTSYLENQMSKENVCSIFSASLRFDDKLVLTCQEFIRQNIASILHTAGFLDLSHEALLLVLQDSKLDLQDECSLYGACIEWAKHHSVDPPSDISGTLIRTQLGDCIKHVRFCNMTPVDFANRVAGSAYPDILTAPEQAQFYSYLLSKSDSSKESLVTMGFNMTQRYPQLIKLSRFPQNTTQYGISLKQESLSLNTNVTVKFHGIAIFLGQRGAQYKIYMDVKRHHRPNTNIAAGFTFSATVALGGTSQGSLLASTSKQFAIEREKEPVEIKLNSPILLQANETYSIQIVVDGPPTYYGTNGITILQHKHVRLTLDNSSSRIVRQQSTLHTSKIQQGQIAQILVSMCNE